MAGKKSTLFKKAKDKADKRRAERRERFKDRFPLLCDILRGITGNPRN